MATSSIPGRKKAFLDTVRTDTWWLEPAIVLVVFLSFIVYSMWAGLQGQYYWGGIAVQAGDYLCPLYSPLIYIKEGVAGAAPLHHAWLGSWPDWLPAWVPASPAIFIVPFPALFRFTCYYYRGAYYKAFAGLPPGCAVGAAGSIEAGAPKKYRGETFLLVFQNLHRYALYFAILFVFILAYDGYLSWFQTDEAGVKHFGFGVGTLLLTINPIFIGMYTFGCHSWRHLIGGRKDCFSCAGNGFTNGVYKKSSWLNANHKLFAWCSLLWVAGTDVYVRLVSSGVITDLNTWN